MSFLVSAESYDQFMGRFAVPLAPLFADFAGIERPMRVADIGCGPGALTTELVKRLGAHAVVAVDPSETFVSAARQRLPGIEVHRARAERLPFADATFDAAVAQLVVHFMSDPVEGLREMARVTEPGGVVAACVWDCEHGASSLLWRAARDLDLPVAGEEDRSGMGEGDLIRLFAAAGLQPTVHATLSVSCQFGTFDEWWEPFTLGVGGAGAFVAGLDAITRKQLREQCSHLLSAGTFVLSPRAWAVRTTANPAC